MSRILRGTLAAAALGVIVFTFSTRGATSALAQGVLRPVQSLIINDASAPVPVAGTVAVTGFPSAITVNNSASNPVPVRDVSNLAPVEILIKDVDMDASTTCATKDVYTVPDAKRFVVEHLSVEMSLPFGQRPISVKLEQPITGTFANIDVVPAQFMGTSDNREFYDADHQTKAYVSSGEHVFFVWCRNQGGDSAVADLAMAGYLQ